MNRTKRLIVLDYLAGRFELGEVFLKRDVNETLRELHPDVAASAGTSSTKVSSPGATGSTGASAAASRSSH